MQENLANNGKYQGFKIQLAFFAKRSWDTYWESMLLIMYMCMYIYI